MILSLKKKYSAHKTLEKHWNEECQMVTLIISEW